MGFTGPDFLEFDLKMAKSIEQLPDLATAEWLNSPALKSVFATLGGGDEVRVVGGAVRNAVLCEEIGDIDLATVHRSDEIMRRTQAAGIKAVATGGSHGTVSLIVFENSNTHVFEVTPLRVDVATDGRHAVVAPTQNWELDARRRDFYINALYCDEAGQIYDPLDGAKDVFARRVRFIGSARQRIEEDYLRILRFFRFSALYGKGELEAKGLAACVARKDGLSQLSSERIKQEMFKLLIAPYATGIIEKMVNVDVMGKVLPGPVCLKYFVDLLEIEGLLNLPALALPRLAALAGMDAGQMREWSQILRLSNKENAYLIDMGRYVSGFSSDLDQRAQKKLLYRLGKQRFEQCAVLAWARAGARSDMPAWKRLISLPDQWPVPTFLLKGADVLAVGILPGPEVGNILSKLEQGWIEAGFVWDAPELFARLKAISTGKLYHHRSD